MTGTTLITKQETTTEIRYSNVLIRQLKTLRICSPFSHSRRGDPTDSQLSVTVLLQGRTTLPPKEIIRAGTELAMYNN